MRQHTKANPDDDELDDDELDQLLDGLLATTDTAPDLAEGVPVIVAPARPTESEDNNAPQDS
jgi:hypothetical protein